MQYSGYELLWFYLLYSVIGWVIGTSAAAVQKKKFVDVGFLYGPYCPAYGFGAVFFAIFLAELKDNLFFLFLGGIVLSFIVIWFTGTLLEKVFHRKWWDYSRKRFQFGGYVNLPYNIIWGGAAVLCICFVNPFLQRMIGFLPTTPGKILLLCLYGILLVDLIGTISGVIAVNYKIKQAALFENISENLQRTADTMGKGLSGWVLKHMEKTYPSLAAKELLAARQEKERQLEEAKEKAGVFAVGCSFYKLICLFFLGAFLGDITETIFCWITTGRLMSRSSVVYGPFSIVWGLGCFLLTAILYQYRNRSDSFIFAFGTILGGGYEYICSVFTELVFGTVFWDYSDIPFNLGGRINLLFCFFWGIAAVAWMKLLYPLLSSLIEKIPRKAGVPLTWILIVFMIFNVIMSGLALNRYTQRNTTQETAATSTDNIENPVDAKDTDSSGDANHMLNNFLDDHFPDERMKHIYPNAILVDK